MQYNTKSNSKTGNVIDFILLKRVLRYAKPYKFYFLIGGLVAILLSFLGPIRPMLINYTIDNHIVIPNKQGLKNITIVLISICVWRVLFSVFTSIYQHG